MKFVGRSPPRPSMGDSTELFKQRTLSVSLIHVISHAGLESIVKGHF